MTEHRPVLEPVDYSADIPYRRPSGLYLRFQWIGFLLTRLDLSPRYVALLEVPGRRTEIIRRTNVVRATHAGAHHLAALGGESEWARNVRAAGGRGVIGRRVRRAATLVEVPLDERPEVLRSYVLRAGRRPGSRRVTREARFSFGVGPGLRRDEPRRRRRPLPGLPGRVPGRGPAASVGGRPTSPGPGCARGDGTSRA